MAAVIVVALIAAIGAWWWTNRDTAIRLGDYGEVTAMTKAGTVGVKCWIFKGEILPTRAGGALLPATRR